MPPSSGGGPNFSLPPAVNNGAPHEDNSDAKSVSSIDDFEARLAALKRL